MRRALWHRLQPVCFWLFLTPLALPAPPALSPQDVLQHLNQTIAWYQRVNALQQPAAAPPQNLLLEDNVRENSKRVVQLAFTFAKTEAAALGNVANTAAPPSASPSLQQAADKADQRVKNLESQIDTLNTQIQRESGRKRITLVSQRDTLAAFLNLAKESQSAIQNMVSFASAPGGGNAASGLLGEINDLQNSDSIPAALSTTQKAAPAQSASTQPFEPQFAGLMSLLTEAVNLAQARIQLDSVLAETNRLLAEIDKVKNPLRTALRTAINEGETLVSASDAQNNPAQVENARKQIQQLAGHFKQLTSVMTPLSEQGIVLQTSRAGLQDWRNSLNQEYKSTLRYLAIRSAVVVLAIILLLVLARLWHTAIYRYVREPRRRRQFMLLRRFVIAFAIVIVVALGFFTSFSSVATFVGFLAAGLALALQNVILSVVAYFFLIGRYGLRVGDRVTVSGVTGQVVEIGLVRFFLMELAGTGADMHPTGRVAVWANSMIFQPYSWLKQAPGGEYVWHALSLTITPDADHNSVRKRLTAAVESVYEEYRESIERQHAAFERSISVQVTAPKPIGSIHFTEAGCEILIRYPVEAQHASDVDAQVMRRIFEEIDTDPKLHLAPGGAPRIQPLV